MPFNNLKTLSFLLGSFLFWGMPDLGAQTRPPNIILILFDDVGQDTLNLYGGTSYPTPHLDQLASEGMTFTRAYSMPLCTPSRTQILTGRSNARNYSFFTCMDPSEPLIARQLRLAGYKTAATGKWQLNGSNHYPEYYLQGTHPTVAGFDEWCLWQVVENGNRYWDPIIELHNATPSQKMGEYGPDIFNDFALDFIERNQGNPFFLYYPMALCHGPFDKSPPGFPNSNDPQVVFSYMHEYMDSLVGNIKAKIDACGLQNDTLIFVASDNGTSGDISSNWNGFQVHGFKGYTVELGIRTPLIAKWPGKVAAGSNCDNLVCFTDFFPTLSEIAGQPMPQTPHFDGISFLDSLTGTFGKTREHIFSWYWPIPDKVRMPAVRRWVVTQDWKLYGDGRFFHLPTDFLENRDLSNSQNPAIQAENTHLQRLMDSYPLMPPAWGG